MWAIPQECVTVSCMHRGMCPGGGDDEEEDGGGGGGGNDHDDGGGHLIRTTQ